MLYDAEGGRECATVHVFDDDVVPVELRDGLASLHHFVVGVVEDSDDDVQHDDVGERMVHTQRYPQNVFV